MARTFDVILVEDGIGKNFFRISNRDKRNVELLYKRTWVKTFFDFNLLHEIKIGLHNNVRCQLVARNVRFKNV